MADSIAKQLINYLKENPKATNQDLYEKYPDVRKNTLRHYKSKFARAGSVPKKESGKKVAKPKTTKIKGSLAIKSADKKEKKVIAYLTKNPKVTNDQLFAEFPTETKVSLRALKQEFKKGKAAKKSKGGKVAVTTQARGKAAVKARSMTAVRAKIDPIAESVKNKIQKGVASVKKKAESKAVLVKKEVLSSDVITRISTLEKKVRQLTSILADTTKKIQLPIMETVASKKPVVEKKLRDLEVQLLDFIKNKRDKVSGELSNLEELQRMVSEKISAFVSGRGKKDKG